MRMPCHSFSASHPMHYSRQANQMSTYYSNTSVVPNLEVHLVKYVFCEQCGRDRGVATYLYVGYKFCYAPALSMLTYNNFQINGSLLSDVPIFRYHYYNSLQQLRLRKPAGAANLFCAGCLIIVTNYSNGNEIQ